VKRCGRDGCSADSAPAEQAVQVEPQVRDIDALVAQFAERDPEGVAARARPEPHRGNTRATGVMWSRIAQISEPTGYGMLGVLRFLQYVPDRDRALAVFGQIAPLITDSVTLDPDAPGEVHSPLDFAAVGAGQLAVFGRKPPGLGG